MGKKVFLGGLSWSSTPGMISAFDNILSLSLTSSLSCITYVPESLCSFFTNLDFEVEKAAIMCDKQTGKSRGFGFIIFSDNCTKELQSHYEVDGRLVC